MNYTCNFRCEGEDATHICWVAFSYTACAVDKNCGGGAVLMYYLICPWFFLTVKRHKTIFIVSYPDPRHSSGWITSRLRGSRIIHSLVTIYGRISRQNRGSRRLNLNGTIGLQACAIIRVTVTLQSSLAFSVYLLTSEEPLKPL